MENKCCEKCNLISGMEYIDQIGDNPPIKGRTEVQSCKNFDCPCHTQEACKQCLNPDLKGVHTCKKDTLELISQEASKEECYCACHNPNSSRPSCEHCHPQPLKTEWEELRKKIEGMRNKEVPPEEDFTNLPNRKGIWFGGYTQAIDDILKLLKDN